ncbi:MAG: DUF1611 domain-containing protein [Ignavibacteriaceae bacterium]|nr:DUF1611 domain-containing protein [Ignavibacteriaceae bacterium]
MPRKIVALTEGYSNPHSAKTARNLIYYCPKEVVAIFDRNNVGKTSFELLGVGNLPVIGSLDDIDDANTLIMSIALPGGKLPKQYKEIMMQAIFKKMNVVSCGHEFISEDPDLVLAAKSNGVLLTDIRKNNERGLANREGINPNCLRILTVGNDCSLGKMVTSIELARALQKRGIDAKFVATGQTGILIEGDGIPIDAVIGDYINGAAEKLVLQNQHHEILVIEGQGSISHPRYSPVSVGLLHGTMPHGMIMCYEVGREFVNNMPGIKIPAMDVLVKLIEKLASVMFPSKVIGFAMYTKKISVDAAKNERIRIKEQFGLPACDVIRDGPEELIEAIINYKHELFKHKM